MSMVITHDLASYQKLTLFNFHLEHLSKLRHVCFHILQPREKRMEQGNNNVRVRMCTRGSNHCHYGVVTFAGHMHWH